MGFNSDLGCGVQGPGSRVWVLASTAALDGTASVAQPYKPIWSPSAGWLCGQVVFEQIVTKIDVSECCVCGETTHCAWRSSGGGTAPPWTDQSTGREMWREAAISRPGRPLRPPLWNRVATGQQGFSRQDLRGSFAIGGRVVRGFETGRLPLVGGQAACSFVSSSVRHQSGG